MVDSSYERTSQNTRAKAKDLTLGRKSFEKISAVEGIRMSAEMKGTFRSLDRSGASVSVRRQVIVKKYGK